jgi:hypothetical protein
VAITIPISGLRNRIESFVNSAWPDVSADVLYERRSSKLLLDKATSPLAAVVWGEPSAGRNWAPDVGTYGFPVDVYYLAQSDQLGQEEETLQAKAHDFLNAAIEAGSRWDGVNDMHGWRLRSSSTRHERSDGWRASGWESARIALEVLFDYER